MTDFFGLSKKSRGILSRHKELPKGRKRCACTEVVEDVEEIVTKKILFLNCRPYTQAEAGLSDKRRRRR